MRTPVAAVLVSAAVLLTGCSSQSFPGSGTAGDTKACFELRGVTDSVAGNAVRTPDGLLLLRGTDLVFDDGGAERVLLRDVEQWYAVETVEEHTVVVYRGTDDGDSAPLISYDVTAGTSVTLGVASTFEYAVTGVAYDSRTQEWIVTAISDLSETFTLIGRTGGGPGERTFAPYEYNSGPYLAAVIPGTGDGFLALEGAEGDVSNWSVASFDRDGKLLERYPWPAGLGTPTGEFDIAAGGSMYVRTGGDADAVVMNGANGVEILSACEPARGRWLSRR